MHEKYNLKLREHVEMKKALESLELEIFDMNESKVGLF